MDYWLNVHHPKLLNESHRSQCMVHIQEKSKQRLSVGARVFIYETEALSNQYVISQDEGNPSQQVKLTQGAKGIIALVKISGPLRRHNRIWNGTSYMGTYDTEEIKTKKSSITFSEINIGYADRGITKTFNPRSYTGLKKLGESEARVLLELMGLS